MLGRDASGVVEGCGTGTTGHQKGDEIYVMLGVDRGTYAEHVIVKANEAARKHGGSGGVGHVAIQFAKARVPT